MNLIKANALALKSSYKVYVFFIHWDKSMIFLHAKWHLPNKIMCFKKKRGKHQKRFWTWLFEACPWIRWGGFIFKSIILVLSVLKGETLWFCWFSPIVSWFWPLPFSLGSTDVSPGNYIKPKPDKNPRRNNKNIIGFHFQR